MILYEHLLVTTLGTSWAIVPEVFGIFNHFYPHWEPPSRAPESVWIITTGDAWSRSEDLLAAWAQKVEVELKVFRVVDSDLDNREQVRLMRELIFRVVLQASETSRELSCSLAGGRKTMSADMQEAARTFGCNRILHVLSNDYNILPNALKNPDHTIFTTVLNEELAKHLTPVVLPGAAREDMLDVDWEGKPPISHKRFPLVLSSIEQNHIFSLPPGDLPSPASLSEEVTGRRSDGGLLSNFLSAIAAEEHHENWRCLYRLPPRLIDKLRRTVLEKKHSFLMRSLPKAELHCHLGGILGIQDQRRVAEAIWEALTEEARKEAMGSINRIDWGRELPDWHLILKKANRSAKVAAVFNQFSDSEIESFLYPCAVERTALKKRHALGFTAYELPGELSGSAVLGHPEAISPTVDGIMRYCARENVLYLELRGSPHKYRAEKAVDWLLELSEAIRSHPLSEKIRIRFIWILDRRNTRDLAKLIQLAVEARHQLPDFMVGVDVAGDESATRPEIVSSHFLPVFEACLPVTIHAGEGEAAQNIWEAAYHLHADRIGHGLTLVDHPDLMVRFADRDICLELCPTSNREVVGFRDPQYPGSLECPEYPLMKLWRAGLSLTLCTDNPGISRCSLSDEYLAASRMCGGLSLWDSLAMIKQGFLHAFATSRIREDQLKAADQEIYHTVLNTTF